MNFYESFIKRRLERKSPYILIWENMAKLTPSEQAETIRLLVKAYMPGKHIQGSYKGKTQTFCPKFKINPEEVEALIKKLVGIYENHI